jgi:hypothetical protein
VTKQEHEVRRVHAVAIAAERVVKATKRTSYQHGIYVDPATGTYVTDCSGFVSLVLEEVAPVHYGGIPRDVAHPYPRAFEFFDYLAKQPTAPSLGWRRIEHVARLAGGDVVAWRRRHVEDDEDSGHVLIAAEPARPLSPEVWALRVYDSTDVRHLDDSRDANGIFQGGIGTGTILVHVDGQDRPTAFQFGPDDAVHELPIAIGRLEALTPPRD